MLVDLSRGVADAGRGASLYPQLIVFGLALVLLLLDAFVPRSTTTVC